MKNQKTTLPQAEREKDMQQRNRRIMLITKEEESLKARLALLYEIQARLVLLQLLENHQIDGYVRQDGVAVFHSSDGKCPTTVDDETVS